MVLNPKIFSKVLSPYRHSEQNVAGAIDLLNVRWNQSIQVSARVGKHAKIQGAPNYTYTQTNSAQTGSGTHPVSYPKDAKGCFLAAKVATA